METPPLNRATVRGFMVSLGIDSTAELARRCGIERTYMSRILNGERPAPASLIRKLAEVFKCPVIALIGPEDETAALEALEAAS